MKKRVKLGLVGLAAGVVGVGSATALGNHLYDLVMTPKRRENDPESPLEPGRCWLREHPARREVTIVSVDGLALRAIALYAVPESHNWAVCIHGYSEDGTSVGHFARHHAERGWNVLVPDLRGHGRSEGAYIGFGWDDRLDIVAWCAWIARRDPQARIVLHGVSMGASTALMTAGGPLSPNVKGVISDCAFTTASDILRYVYHSSGRQYGPASAALAALRGAVRRRAKYDLRKADAVAAVRSSRTPTLFIHGVADELVPAAMMAELYENARCPKEFLWVPKAGHARSALVAPGLYWGAVDEWLERLLEE